jgi:hypothetical protein
VSALPGWESATVSWVPGSDGGSPVTTYTVTAIPDAPLISAAAVVTCPVAPPATSCTMTGLSNDTTYTFTVTATNKNGTSPASSPSNAVTPPVVLPLGAEYQYTTTDPGQGFDEPDFDDTGWETGNAPFAQDPTAGTCPDATFPDGNSPFPVNGEVWVRVTFELPAGASGLQIVGTIDNVADFFVNGNPVGSMTDGSCHANTVNILIEDQDLVEGTNVLAVHATDTGSRSFLDLTVKYTEPVTGGEATAATSAAPETTTTSTSTTTSTTTTAPPVTTEETTTTTSTPAGTE